MKNGEIRTVIQAAADRLRAIVLDTEVGALIGSEDALVSQLGCSRSTVRQVARLLEREGLLRVRRGINGGYFGARPDTGTIEATVSAYLETLQMDPQDVTILASSLWVLAVRKAAVADPAAAREMFARMRPRLAALPRDATFDAVQRLERDIQAEIFQLGNSNYIKLIFDINVAFSRRRRVTPINDDDRPYHVEFLTKWRDAKMIELNAIESGDAELAAMAAQYSRQLWHQRVWRRYPG
jgi:DNA-binding FadR family transcriptional regulator